MTKEELKEKISKDLEDHKAEKFFRISDYTNKENESHLFLDVIFQEAVIHLLQSNKQRE